MRALVLIAALALPGAANAAQQFDLDCVGTSKAAPNGPARPLHDRYRIDLDAMRWCMGDCAETWTIKAATAARITFEDDENKATDGSSRWHFISRTTGELSKLTHLPPLFANDLPFYYDETATCTAAPFSGMPAPKF